MGLNPEELLKRVQARLDAPGKEKEDVQEELRRLRHDRKKLQQTISLMGFVHHWTESLIEGTLTVKDVLGGIAKGLGLRHLVLWRKEGAHFVWVGRAGSGTGSDIQPVRVGVEISGATWAMGKPRFYPDVTMAPSSVQNALWAKGDSLLSFPIKTGNNEGWVLEAMDLVDGCPLGTRVVEEVPILSPWIVLAASQGS